MCVRRLCVQANTHTHNADDYSSILLGDSSTIAERSRLFELWSNNSVPLPLYKWIQYRHIYHYHRTCTQLASFYLERVLEINPVVLFFAQTTLQVIIISLFSDSLYINCSLWHWSDLVRRTRFLLPETTLLCLSAAPRWYRITCTLVVFFLRHAFLHLAGQLTAVWGV